MNFNIAFFLSSFSIAAGVDANLCLIENRGVEKRIEEREERGVERRIGVMFINFYCLFILKLFRVLVRKEMEQ